MSNVKKVILFIIILLLIPFLLYMSIRAFFSNMNTNSNSEHQVLFESDPYLKDNYEFKIIVIDNHRDGDSTEVASIKVRCACKNITSTKITNIDLFNKEFRYTYNHEYDVTWDDDNFIIYISNNNNFKLNYSFNYDEIMEIVILYTENNIKDIN